MQYGRVYVYNKNNELIAVFDGDGEGKSEDAMREMIVSPVVTLESNGVSTLSFQALANSNAWQTIKDPENIYYVNGRYYTALTENAYTYSGKDTARLVTVTLVETWALLKNKYVQAYNCGIYTQAKGTVTKPSIYYGSNPNVLYFTGRSDYCSNLGNTITTSNAYAQVRNWTREDKDGNLINYRLIPAENAPKDAWIGAPQIVNITRKTDVNLSPFVFELENPVKPTMRVMIPLGGNTINFGATSNMSNTSYSVMDALYDYFQQKYGNDDLKITSSTYYIMPPSEIKSVEVTYTATRLEQESNSNSEDPNKNKTVSIYNSISYTDKVEYQYTNGSVKFKKPPNYVETSNKGTIGSTSNTYNSEYASNGTTFQYLTVEFEFPNMGAFKIGSSLEYTISYGAEVVDEHTFLILPKADTKYKLTINGREYSDSQVEDSRGVVMPRGSGGYAMWAALKDTDWTLGVCDVIAKNFNASIDYGCFNVETDMKDVLTIIQNIQSLYGGILDWDSEHKILNYRAENSEDYQAYNDDFNKWKGYQFRQGKNLTEQPTIIYDNDIITKAYLLGYGNLNVKKVNGDKSYITDYSYSKATYEGYLMQELIYDTNDEGGQKQLLYWGQKEIKKRCRPRKTVSMQVTDVRTVAGHEHEVFDINHIVQAYYHDSQDNSEHIEELRVVYWQYNVFAMWDCTVELGDKTSNLTEIFELIYNKSKNSPNANGSGQISSSSVTLTPSSDSTTVAGQWGILSQTTTDNSNAIAGLIIDTSANYSYAHLFAQYQKQTAQALTQAYAGLEFYADSKMAQAKLESRYHTEKTVKDSEDRLTTIIVNSVAGAYSHADENMAKAGFKAIYEKDTISYWGVPLFDENGNPIYDKYGNQLYDNMTEVIIRAQTHAYGYSDENMTKAGFSAIRIWDSKTGKWKDGWGWEYNNHTVEAGITGLQQIINEDFASIGIGAAWVYNSKTGLWEEEYEFDLNAVWNNPEDYPIFSAVRSVANREFAQTEILARDDKNGQTRYIFAPEGFVIEQSGRYNWSTMTYEELNRLFYNEYGYWLNSLPASIDTDLFEQGAENAILAYNRISEVTLNPYEYNGATMIDGHSIITGTVTASNIQGGVISLIASTSRRERFEQTWVDSRGDIQTDIVSVEVEDMITEVGRIKLTSASSADYAVELESDQALRIAARRGDFYVIAHERDIYDPPSLRLGWFEYGYKLIRCLQVGNADLIPGRSGVSDLGKNYDFFWKEVSAVNFVQASDKNLKNSISYDMTKYDGLFDNLKPANYKFNDNTSNRTHIGMIAQDVEQAINDSGLSSLDFAGFIKGDKADGTTGYSLRYSEFIALCIDQIQKLKKRVAELEKAR